MIENSLFNFKDISSRKNALQAFINGLNRARMEAVMFSSSHVAIDALIARYQKRLDRLSEQPIEKPLPTEQTGVELEESSPVTETASPIGNPGDTSRNTQVLPEERLPEEPPYLPSDIGDIY